MPNGIFTDLINVDVDVAVERTQKRGFINKIIDYHCPYNSGEPNKPFYRVPNKPFRWISFRKAYYRLRFSDDFRWYNYRGVLSTGNQNWLEKSRVREMEIPL